MSWLPWDGTFVAAFLALAASVAGLIWNSKHNKEALRARNKAQASIDRLSNSAAWFARFQMAGAQLESRNKEIQMAGLALLRILKNDGAATPDEKALVIELLAIFEDKVKAGGR